MTVFKRGGSFYHYQFQYRKTRYSGSTEQVDRADAQAVEAEIKKKLRQARWGLGPLDRDSTPSFTEFAEHLLAHKQATLTRPDTFERTLRMVLTFWGSQPRKTSHVCGGLYHNLRLLDPISDPTWIVRFDEWMASRRLSASSKNSYRSVMSQFYKLALKPRWRATTRMKENPFEHIDRDRPRRRHIELSLEDIRRWMFHAEPHARLALAIGALAPKLRLNQVLGLRFSQHFDAEFTTITFSHHKTSRFANQPQKTAIVSDLRVILVALRTAKPGSDCVVTYRGKSIKDPKRALRSAAKAAGLKWGVKHGGVTFHALRHALATAIARLGGISRLLHAAALGHLDPRTTDQYYTHLNIEDQRAVLEQVAPKLGIRELVLADLSASVARPSRRNISKRKLGSDAGPKANLPMSQRDV